MTYDRINFNGRRECYTFLIGYMHVGLPKCWTIWLAMMDNLGSSGLAKNSTRLFVSLVSIRMAL